MTTGSPRRKLACTHAMHRNASVNALSLATGGSFTDAAGFSDMHAERTPSPTRMGRQHSSSLAEAAPAGQDTGLKSASRHQQIWQAVCCTEGGDVHVVTLACLPGLGDGNWHASAQVRSFPQMMVLNADDAPDAEALALGVVC